MKIIKVTKFSPKNVFRSFIVVKFFTRTVWFTKDENKQIEIIQTKKRIT